MADKIDICRMALRHIGNDVFIEDLNEESKEAKTCKAFYETAKQSLLRKFNYNIANTKKTLALYGTAPQNWTYQYKYPNDCLKAIRLTPIADEIVLFDVSTDSGIKVIQTDLPEAELEYTVNVIDSAIFDPTFILALSYKLASLICTPLSADKTMLEIVERQYGKAVYEAEAIDGNEGTGKESKTPVYIDARS